MSKNLEDKLIALRDKLFNRNKKFEIMYPPYSEDLSKSAVIGNLYGTIKLNTVFNNIDVDIDENEWNIIFNNLYDLYFTSGLVKYCEAYVSKSIVDTLMETRNLNYEDFFKRLIPPLDLQLFEESALITNVELLNIANKSRKEIIQSQEKNQNQSLNLS